MFIATTARYTPAPEELNVVGGGFISAVADIPLLTELEKILAAPFL
jgi:hypothetical protein